MGECRSKKVTMPENVRSIVILPEIRSEVLELQDEITDSIKRVVKRIYNDFIYQLNSSLESRYRCVKVSASAHERDQIIMMELQAKKKAFYDENQKLRNQLSAPRIALPKFLSFLKTN